MRGPHVAGGYWNREQETVEPWVDGWFHSGDVARADNNGWLWFADRIKHVIISGGENIYPAELERILHETPHLKEAAVVGRADSKWGEVPVVVAVKADDGCDEAAVMRLFDQRIARYKQPHAVMFIDALPRTALGKVSIAALREQVAETN